MNTKTDFTNAMHLQMTRWDAEVDALAAEGRKASGELRTAFDRRLKELRLLRASARKSLAELEGATQAAGLSLQEGMQAAWASMQAALAKVSGDLRKPPVAAAPVVTPVPATPEENPA